MPHTTDTADRAFRAAFEAGQIAPAEFDHRAHVRLAYVYLAESGDDAALAAMRRALQAFLQTWGIGPGKYHETLTRAWLLAVRHFMAASPPCGSADAFIARHPALLDPGLLHTHYSAALLFSDAARTQFVPPDLEAIPRHGP